MGQNATWRFGRTTKMFPAPDIMGENHTDPGGTQLDEMSGEDVSDGDDASGGQSDVEVGPISARPLTPPSQSKWKGWRPVSSGWLPWIGSLFTQRLCLMKECHFFWVYERLFFGIQRSAKVVLILGPSFFGIHFFWDTRNFFGDTKRKC